MDRAKEKIPLKLSGVSKAFGNLKAVDGVSFAIQPGEIFGLLGPNGAGKTTIISMIMTLQHVDCGTIEIFGKNPARHSRDAKLRIGYVPQELINHGYFTLQEILEFHSSYYGIKSNQQRIDYLLDRLELSAHRHKLVSQLSGGMKRRLLIAKALVHSPKLILLDEPTAGVDIELRSLLYQFIEELKTEGCSILLTTHYLEEAERLCDRVGFIQQGKLIRVDTISKLLEILAHRELTITLKEKLPYTIESPYIKEQKDRVLRFVVPKTFPFQKLISHSELPADSISDLSIREGNLEDVFQILLDGGA